MGIKENIAKFSTLVQERQAGLVAICKTHPIQKIREAYDAGQRIFGENKVQEMVEKQPNLPSDIAWHLVGHLQTNKVKYIAPFVALIHAVDSQRLLKEISKQGEKAGRVIPCLLQVYIATEETKFGLDAVEVLALIQSGFLDSLPHVQVEGLMGMASLTDDREQVRREFKSLRNLFEQIKAMKLPNNVRMKELSMGMSADYDIALQEGSTLIRVGTGVFGERSKIAEGE